MRQSVHGRYGEIHFERDGWGKPTIYVETEDQAVWAKGYFHSTDRLMQVHLAAMLAEGRAMELLGDQPFTRLVDRSVRLLNFRGGLTQAIRGMTPELRHCLEVYCEGFQAGMDARGYPAVLRAAGLHPRRWSLYETLLTLRMLAWFGLTSTTQLAKAVIGEMISRGVDAEGLKAALGPGAEGLDIELLKDVPWPSVQALLGNPTQRGSNAFGLSGERTASGSPMVLAEFHLEVGGLPPLLYPLEIRYSDGRFVYGMTAPGVPHIYAGRNADVAWTYTFGHADNVDLTVETVEGERVRVGKGHEPLERRMETVLIRESGVRGLLGKRKIEQWTYWDLPAGASLLCEELADGKVPAMRWWGLEDPLTDHVALLNTLKARSVSDLIEAHRGLRVMSAGAIFADVEGEIAWMQTGVVPENRSGWGPRVRGEGDRELPEDKRPLKQNPKDGVLVACNQAHRGWTAFPEPPWRFKRLRERLLERSDWSLETAWSVTYERYDPMAAALMPLWGELLPDTQELRSLVNWSKAQNVVSDEEWIQWSERFHGLHELVSRKVLTKWLGESNTAFIFDSYGLPLAFQAELDEVLALRRPERLDAEDLSLLLREVWEASAETRGACVGVARFTHPVTQGALSPAFGLSSPPVQWPGSPTSLFQTRVVRFLGQELKGGPMFHLLMDLSDPCARYNVAGGVSERPGGPGYGKGIEAWRAGRWLPMGPEA